MLDYTGGDVNLDDDVQDDYHSSLALARKLKQAQKMEPKLVCHYVIDTLREYLITNSSSCIYSISYVTHSFALELSSMI